MDPFEAELASIGEGEPRCGYSHVDHTHTVDVDDETTRHTLVCLRRPGHEGARVMADVHLGRMPDGQLVVFAEVPES